MLSFRFWDCFACFLKWLPNEPLLIGTWGMILATIKVRYIYIYTYTYTHTYIYIHIYIHIHILVYTNLLRYFISNFRQTK